MTSTTARTEILQRIANLRARADDDASSEAEVIAAMTRASRLMDAYAVTEAELALAEAQGEVRIEIVSRKVNVANGTRRHRAQMCWHAIEALTHTQGVRYTRSNQIELTGDAPDVEFAMYLFDLIRVGMDRAYDQYRRETPTVGRGAKAQFQTAFALAVNTRLADMARDREAAVQDAASALSDARTADQRTALVVADAIASKVEAVTAEFKRRHPRVRCGAGWSAGRYNGTAHAAGAAAGNRLGLGRGVGQAGGQRLPAA